MAHLRSLKYGTVFRLFDVNILLIDTTLHPYITILHSAARLVNSLKPRNHITPALRQLHWLPIKARISFKICVLMFNIHSGSCPRYMSSLVTPCTKVESRSSLRSSSKGDYVTQRTSSSFGRREFAVTGPSELNHLHPSRTIYRIIQNQTKTSSFSNLLRIII